MQPSVHTAQLTAHSSQLRILVAGVLPCEQVDVESDDGVDDSAIDLCMRDSEKQNRRDELSSQV